MMAEQSISDQTLGELPSVIVDGQGVVSGGSIDESIDLFDDTMISSTQIKPNDTKVLLDKSKLVKKAKTCIDGCKYHGTTGKNKKEEDTVQCHLCQHWIHPTCVGEKGEDIINVWSCPTCRTTPDLLHAMFDMMIAIQQDNEQLKQLLSSKVTELQNGIKRQSEQLKKATDMMTAKSAEHSEAVKEIGQLRNRVADMTTRLNTTSWKQFNNKPDMKSLVVGSSIVRDMCDSHMENTEVICLPGGRIKDVHMTVTAKPPNMTYERMVLVAGGNDCAPRDPATASSPSDIVTEYRSLVRTAKKKANSVTVSSVCPRNESAGVRARIESVNAGLQVMCNEEKATFVDSTPSFHLADGSVNDAYFLNDNVHLTYKATDKLAQNLMIKLKDGYRSVCDTRPKRHQKSNGNPQGASESTSHGQYTDLSHQFWSYATKKASRPKTTRNQQPTYHESHTTTDDTRCHNCYERNHTAKTCRHEGPITCRQCGAQGHKQKHHSD